jgi:hypothetical protein
MRERFGILGVFAFVVFVVWFVGWVFFNMRDGYWHVLVPIAAAAGIVQGVRRVHAE